MRIENNRDTIMILGAVLFLMGADCLRMSLMGGVPMPPETHGSAIYEIPAEMWGLAVMAQSGALFIGARIGCAPFVAFAGLMGGLIYIALAVMADQASLGFITSRGAAVFGVMNTAAGAAALMDILAKWLERQIEQSVAWAEERQRENQ